MTTMALVGLACQGTIGDTAPDVPITTPPRAPFEPLPAGLRTMTPSQYAASVRAVLGLADAEGPIEPLGQWASSIAAARGGFSPTTVEAYEQMAYTAAHHLFEDGTRRDAFLGCAPSPECSRAVVDRIGRRAFRRSLTEEESARWSGVADQIGVDLGDGYLGLEYAVAGLLQSPHFLYRVELGEPEGDLVVYTDHEMATRLAYLVWNQTPDDALLDAADRGALSRQEDIAAEVRRMLLDPRAEHGLREFLAELLDASGLEGLEKDPAVFPQFDSQMAASMREQLILTAAASVTSGGYGSLFTSRTTFVDDHLAPLYGLDPIYGEALTEVTVAGARAGILTTPGYLALHAYPGKTSPALRGLFVRKRLLCQDIPPPPAGVDTTLPELPEGELVTTRELVALHQESETCGACHRLMDPIGLGLEEFDAIGAHRTTENMLDIDPSGELEGVRFDDAIGLGATMAAHPRLLPCLVANLYAFAAANTVAADDPALQAMLDALDGDDVAGAIVAIATDDLFRFAYPDRGEP